MKKELNILIVVVAVWCAGIVFPSVIAYFYAMPLEKTALHGLYRFYGTVCHQIDSRSFHVNGHSFTVCIRCSAIYFGFLFSLVLVRFVSGLHHRQFNPIHLLLVSSVPMVIDVLCSFFPFYEITTLSRLFTGSILGIGLALLLHRSLTEFISSLSFIRSHEINTR